MRLLYDQDRCENCKFYSGKYDDGQCRKNAPVVNQYTDYPGPIWPRVCETHWCGDFKKGDVDERKNGKKNPKGSKKAV